MGLMRRVESRLEKSAGATPQQEASEPSRRGNKKESKLYVQPRELAAKLVQEMEYRKDSELDDAKVCDIYTIFLCSKDFERLTPEMKTLEDDLGRHLEKHLRKKRYQIPGERVQVDLVEDRELPLGKFGILAECSDAVDPSGIFPSVGSFFDEGGSEEVIFDEPQLRPTVPAPPVVPAVAAAVSAPRVPQPVERVAASPTEVILVRSGNRLREYSQSRVVLGRGRDVDFRVDDPNVSRRHASIYLDEGLLMVQDLQSTNGTMVNGYPITKTVLRPTDVLVIGDCRITAEARLHEEA